MQPAITSVPETRDLSLPPGTSRKDYASRRWLRIQPPGSNVRPGFRAENSSMRLDLSPR